MDLETKIKAESDRLEWDCSGDTYITVDLGLGGGGGSGKDVVRILDGSAELS